MGKRSSLYESMDLENRMTAAQYLSSMNENKEAAAEMYKTATLTGAELEQLRRAVENHGGQIVVAAMTEDWCGDAAMILPLLFEAEDQIDGLMIRVFRRADLPQVESQLKAEGFDHLPVIVLFDSKGEEIGRFMERSNAANRMVEEYWRGKPDPNELMASNDEEKVGEAVGMFKQLVAEMQNWYRDGLWRDTAAELIATISR